jgi:uncharacterized protein (TIGR03067 family)
MRPAVLLLALPAVLLPSSTPALGDASDLHRLSAEIREHGLPGVWRVVEWTNPAGQARFADDFTMEFGDGRMVVRRGKLTTVSACVTDDTWSPRWMTCNTTPSVYQIDHDTLTICVGERGKRPKTFKVGGQDGGGLSSP